ncbi:MBL fold metallo-hydrolase [Helicobacter labacensis]|uniref:MBL fold metallo-hydrolase n=1 Tax=Helicobacter labacensis TaxID=2316079 RepID=UPI000EB15622|nr:MBL fold metallo-hydrolase [Helicobacter labacensis]
MPPKNASSSPAPVKLRRVGLFETNTNTQSLSVRGLLEGINDMGEFIIKMKKHVKMGEKPEVDWIIDTICDHRGDKLLHNKGIASCPHCMWNLHLSSLSYDNGRKKQPLKYRIEGRTLQIETSTDLANPYQSSFKGDFKIRYLNHACLYIEAGGIKFITDPWLLGPAFLGAGYLEKASCKEALYCLVHADFIFISSNRSSCLHPQTLAFAPRSKPFIVGNFASKSVERALKNLGFSNIFPLEFQEIYEFSSFFQFSVFKAGDDSEDSGLYLCLCGHDVLINPYANYINRFNLPSGLTLLCTAFFGETSGFPFCVDNYSGQEKKALHNAHLEGQKQQLEKLIHLTNPAYVMPIATPYLQESSRDAIIKRINTHNDISECSKICDLYSRTHRENPVKCLPPNDALTLEFKTADLVQWQEEIHTLKKDLPAKYTQFYAKTFSYDPHKLMGFLKLSAYKAYQIVSFIPTNDNFDKVVAPIVEANFVTQSFKIVEEKALISVQQGYRVMQLRVRQEILACIVENHLPFEEMLRGFHCRIKRNPNAYEASFWYHFSHLYSSPKAYSLKLD